MKQLVTLLICYTFPIWAHGQSAISQEELRKKSTPYQQLLPAYILYSFALEKKINRDAVFQPVVEQFDYFSTPANDWQPAFKYEYDYLSNGNLYTSNEFNYSLSMQSWTNTKKVSYGYDVFELPETVMEEVYNAADGSLVPQTLLNLLHTQAGNLEQEQISFWNVQTASWLPDHKHNYNYTTSGKEQSVIHADWADTSMDWNPYEEYYSLYDINDNLIRYLGSEWNLDVLAWLPSTKDTIEYDLFHNLLRTTSESWSVTSNIWTPYYRNEYEHDAAGNLIRITGQSWDESLLNFQNSNQYLFSFNGDVLEENIFQVWSTTSLEWNNFNRTVYVYDSTSLLIEKVIHNWTDDNWVATYRYLYVNDAYGNVIQSTGQSWNNSTAEWNNIERYTASWISFTTNTGEAATDFTSVLVFPNPVSQQLFIAGLQPTMNYSALITDVSGKVRLNTNFKNEQSVSVDELTEGVYLLSIKENGRNVVAACKLIISK